MYLRDGESYFTVVRVTNKLGYTYALRSDGIAIQLEPLLPGKVRDGPIIGRDLNYQQSTSQLHGNWDSFGQDRKHSGFIVNGELGNEYGRIKLGNE